MLHNRAESPVRWLHCHCILEQFYLWASRNWLEFEDGDKPSLAVPLYTSRELAGGEYGDPDYRRLALSVANINISWLDTRAGYTTGM